MSYQVLARKWRPAQFKDVVGQSHVVAALSNALDQDRVHHAFLFTGTRGVGKTTLARIFAKALNCEKGVSATPCGECTSCKSVVEGRYIDLIEVDAASRTKVDDTRELLENVQYAPTQGRYKVYLIDEVHMLSTHSFNALLKTLEEPPSHVKFLLATTDPQKLPMTVLSRCIQFSLNAIELPAIEQQLTKILDSEKIQYEPAALNVLARAADGSLRDALSLLDQAIAYSDQQLTQAGVRDMLGLVDGQSIVAIIDALANNDADALMQTSEQLVHAAQDLKTALDDLLSYFHALSLYQFAPDAIQWKGLKVDEVGRLAGLLSPEVIQLYYQITLNGKRDFAFAPDPRTGFEMVLLRLLAFQPKSAMAKNVTNVGGALPTSLGDKRDAGASTATRTSVSTPAVSNKSAKVHESRASDTASSTEQAPNVANLSEPVEPFLSDGLNNDALQQHIQPASMISPPEKPVAAKTVSTDEQSEQTIDFNEIIDNIEAWSDFVSGLGLSGMARQLAVHMTPLTLEAGVLRLQVDERYSNLQSSERVQHITSALNQASGQTFRLELESGQVAQANTAAGVIAERERSSLEKTRADFKEDENVKELVTLFDAQVEDSSIKPVN